MHFAVLLQNPWTHFFRDNTSGGPTLIAAFQAAHGLAEDYAGIPAAMISSSNPALLQNLVQDNGFTNQPNEFPTRTIEAEVKAASPLQPANNAVAGTSATWQGLYAQFVAGAVIAPPYHDVQVTDAAKLATATAAYRAFLAGTLPAAQLPDVGDVLPGDARLRDMGFMVKAGLTGAEIVTQACTQCHNANLPPTLTRARFDADLTKMARAERDVAITRIELPASDPLHMPPARFRTLAPDEIQAVAAELKK